ncbi:3-hydroxyacyl-CoA dehydrogenase NAD-binding domain-containing protein [Acidicapsa dinghuensis]|uniref:3-hydroxyacyl-CoA dehydrogenase NAD-binding domain-containing protein n=1 Tax=Acidicapsa dinghuensis TaxID=2218256 RepID=A0ABW1EL34_9BACT|nr:3-hydroxyacyl-CoA dehydrogenase NAD-binding domain-containing protein [Acidicapsa dinghuensis]
MIPAETTLAILGAGSLGRRLAHRAASAGFRVILEDVMPASLRHAQEDLRQSLGPEAMPRVTFARSIEEAVREADLAVDCVPDELESKLEIFSLLDRMAPPKTVLLTPTTNLSIADLASCTYRPGQCVAVHVDATVLAQETHGAGIPVVFTAQTTESAQKLVEGFWQQLGYSPIISLDSSAV